MAFGKWGDGGLWGDGTLYGSSASISEYVTENEQHPHRLSVRITYTTSSTPDALVIHQIRARLAPDSQRDFTYMAYVDQVTPSEKLALVIRYSGSEFVLSHVYVIAQRKKHQPKG